MLKCLKSTDPQDVWGGEQNLNRITSDRNGSTAKIYVTEARRSTLG